jgi:hypothetical protein
MPGAPTKHNNHMLGQRQYRSLATYIISHPPQNTTVQKAHFHPHHTAHAGKNE